MKKLVSVLCSVVFIPALVFAADNPLSSHTTSQVLDVSPSASSNSYQVARTYYLPDYQQELNNVSGGKYNNRTEKDTSNRNKGCEDELASPKSGSGWNCGKVPVNHRICYHCEPKGCPSGQVSKEICMARTNGSNGWTWSGTSSYTGDTQCGNCVAKTCATSFKSSASQCGTCGANGWTLNTSSGKACYNGDKTLGTCVAKSSCPSGQMTQAACYAKTNGSNGWTWTASSGCVGDTKCGTCVAKSCDTSRYKDTAAQCGTKGSKGWTVNKAAGKVCYNGDKTLGTCEKLSCNKTPYAYAPGVSSCSPSDGYALKQDTARYNGDTVCGYCQINDCSGKTKQSDCNTSNGYTFTSSCKSGTTVYGTCKANTCSGTKQSDCNTSNGYTFTANGCKSASVSYGTCKANTCSGTKQSDCNTSNGYTFTANGCKSAGVSYGTCKANSCSGTAQSACNTSNGYTFTANGCKSAGVSYGTCKANSCSGTAQSACNTSNGYTFTANGCKSAGVNYGTCKANSCSGVTAVAKCGTSGANGWTWTANGCKSAGVAYGSCSKKACTSGKIQSESSCASNQAWSSNSYWSGDNKCGSCITTCTVTSCEKVEYQINGNLKITMPGTYSPQFCLGGSGSTGGIIKDNCGNLSCGKCNPVELGKVMFNYSSSCSAMEETLKQYMSNCYNMSAPVSTDKSVCYTIANIARKIKSMQDPYVCTDTYVFYCPPDMDAYCGEDNYWGEITDSFKVNGVSFKRFQCDRLPSCRKDRNWSS